MSKKLWNLQARENDGTGNNLANDAWGQAGTLLLRDYIGAAGNETPAIYGAGGAPRPFPVNSGKLSDLSANPSAPIDFVDEAVRTELEIENTYGTNELTAFYGQFITHDMTASAVPVPVPVLERLFPTASGNPADPDFLLSLVNRTGSVTIDGVREQLNGVTHYLDLSAVYGSGQALPTAGGPPTNVNDALRINSTDIVEHAKLLTGANGGLPTFGDVLDNNATLNPITAAWGPAFGAFTGDTNQLVAGDARAAQQPFLAAIQSVWLKEHNYQVEQLAQKYADKLGTEITSDDLFNMARAVTEAEHQHVIYEEYLSAIIGDHAVKTSLEFTGYDDGVNGGVRNLFTTVAFRFGHDQQSEEIQLRNADGSAAGDPLNLAVSFLQTSSQLQSAGGLENVLRGLSGQKSQEVDGKLVPSLIDNVLNIPGLNLNLGLLDNVRAADHGIGTLNQVRAQLGLAVYTSFAQLTSDAAVQAKLAEYYGHIDNVDPWIGGLLEKHVYGSQLGETFQAIVIEQFKATMAGDRYYFEERLKDFPELIAEIKGITFAEIADRNTDTEHSHLDSFHVAYRIELGSGNDVKWGADHDGYLKADLMIGGYGKDKLFGGEGDDTLYGDHGNDKLYGGYGDDNLKGGEGHDYAYGGAGDDKAWGEAGNDKIWLDKGDDWADGGWGNDCIWGGDGHDIVLGKEGNDYLSGGWGHDKLFGGDGCDAVLGGDGDDYCYGGAGDDCVSGGKGNDLVDGGYGHDKLSGGYGWDVFAFDKGSGKDKILDFNVKYDVIDLSQLESFRSYEDLYGAITKVRGGTLISLGDTDGDGCYDSILLCGVNAKSLQAHNFIYATDEPDLTPVSATTPEEAIVSYPVA